MKTPTHTYRNRPVRIAAAGSTPESVVIELLDSTYIDADTEHYNRTEVYASELTATAVGEATTESETVEATPTGIQLGQNVIVGFKKDEAATITKITATQYTVTTADGRTYQAMRESGKVRGDNGFSSVHIYTTCQECGTRMVVRTNETCRNCEWTERDRLRVAAKEEARQHTGEVTNLNCWGAGTCTVRILAVSDDTEQGDYCVLVEFLDAAADDTKQDWINPARLTFLPIEETAYSATCGCTGYDYCAVCAATEEVAPAPTAPTATLENEDVWQAVACYEAGYKLTEEQKALLHAAAHDTTRRDVVIMHSLGIVTTLQEAWLAKVEGRPVAESLHGKTKKTAGRIEFRFTETVNTMLGRLVADGEEKSAVLRCGVELYYRRKYGNA